ncbi:hypothetical protein CEXT_776771 [Caerostris extrusa]|uniref:Uncharacterized protein n=1 Tax=Caerostris extrusa TaxID=172846 RepID=A0AAV4WJ51_CAEEX|nr:hypothetical protein CEXT_776771 [Caerostris extrusa]
MSRRGRGLPFKTLPIVRSSFQQTRIAFVVLDSLLLVQRGLNTVGRGIENPLGFLLQAVLIPSKYFVLLKFHRGREKMSERFIPARSLGTGGSSFQ